MNSSACSIIAVVSVGLLSHCKPRESEENAQSSKRVPARSKENPARQPEPAEGGGRNHKDAQGLAMNRTAEIHAILTQAKPEWLSLGKPVMAETLSRKDENIEWRSAGSPSSKISYSAGQKERMIGSIPAPEAPEGGWAAAIPTLNGDRVLMVPLEMTESSWLYRIGNDAIVEDSREEVPVINFDDKRRWFIQWEGWISESEIVGVFNEDDFSGHVSVRSGLYLYNVDSRELRRVELPYGFVTGNDPIIGLEEISSDAVVILTNDGKKVISLKR